MTSPASAKKANGAEGQRLRKKRFSTRVRTGCITCRIRRIKCDETRPSCCRCVSTGRKCDGYPAPVSSEVSQEAAQPAYCPSSHKNPAGQHAMYMFRTKIATLIGSEVDADFWKHDLLHFAEAYRPVRLAVAALSAAYHVSVLSEHKRSHADDQFALAQYTNSLTSLHRCLGTGKVCTRREQMVVLITNQLFIYLCSLLELHSEASLHLQNGLALFQEWKFGIAEEEASLETTPTTTVNFVVAAYARLETQARALCQRQTPAADMIKTV